MPDFEAIRILFFWTLIVIALPGVVFQQTIVWRIDELAVKAFAWFLFVLAEVALHVVVILALIRGWIGGIGYRQVIEFLNYQSRYLTRSEQTLAGQFTQYLEFKLSQLGSPN